MQEQELLHAYADGQLDPVTHAQVEASLSGDDAARAAVAAWQIQNERLRALERATLDEPVPLALIAAATPDPRVTESGASPQILVNRRERRGNRSQAMRAIDRVLAQLAHNFERLIGRVFGAPAEHSVIPQAVAIALVLLLGLGTGWFGHRAWADRDQRAELARAISSEGVGAGAVAQLSAGADGAAATGGASITPATVAHSLMRDAMVAHVVYTSDARRPVEVPANEHEQLVRWLSRRLGRPLQMPALADLGWDLVGGRLLPGDTGGTSAARAQFMYQDKAGQRLTLYLSVLDPAVVKRKAGAPDGAATKGSAGDAAQVQLAQKAESSTAFSYASRDKTNSFYWTEGLFGYALVGELPRSTLEKISVEVYMQTVGLGGAESKR
ncbi:MAG: hypothetical protein RIQ60_3400 [Pseudomonadota bacterium]|jgi:anti-sigma factor RsiW